MTRTRTLPAPGSLWRKHWPDTSHGSRYTYTVLRVDGRHVHWRRSDGLEGQTLLADWGVYMAARA